MEVYTLRNNASFEILLKVIVICGFSSIHILWHMSSRYTMPNEGQKMMIDLPNYPEFSSGLIRVRAAN